MIHGVNAAGLSAFNPVERRMAPLSRDHSGIILPHETYGSHLNNNGKTIDFELEKKNFYAAAEALSDVWNQTTIDNHQVDCKPIKKGCEFQPKEEDPKFIAKHVLQSRYSLQIVKCLDQKCCEPFQTDWLKLFPKRFIPPPTACQYGPKGLEVVEPSEFLKNSAKYRFATHEERLLYNLESKESKKSKSGISRPTPFDTYCPSMNEKIDDCFCKICGKSWPCKAALKRHLKAHDNVKTIPSFEKHFIEVQDEFDTDEELDGTIQEPDMSEAMPVITDMKSHMTSIYPFEECSDSLYD